MALHVLDDRSDGEALLGSTQAVPHAATELGVIGAASGIGAADPGCGLGPDALREYGLTSQLRDHGLKAVWADIVRRPALRAGTESIKEIKTYCEELAAAVRHGLHGGRRVALIGGDHSCAIASWSAIASALCGPLGLVWIDAHMDSHTPATSPSGALHGMPLAILLGVGPPELTDLLYPGAKLRPENVCLVGVRSYEPEEADLLHRLGVRVITMGEVRARGLMRSLGEAFAIASRGAAAVGLSIDLDAIDPTDAPGVGTPAPNGLRGLDLVESLRRLAPQPALAEIAEFNPLHDREDKTARLVIDLLAACWRR
ncbi:MAG: arginase [Pseudomonadota bacterium]|nr:arginase [Pseudomonadota bacterium]